MVLGRILLGIRLPFPYPYGVLVLGRNPFAFVQLSANPIFLGPIKASAPVGYWALPWLLHGPVNSFQPLLLSVELRPDGLNPIISESLGPWFVYANLPAETLRLLY